MDTVMVLLVKCRNNDCTSGKVSINGDNVLSANPALAVFMYVSFVQLSSFQTLRCISADVQSTHN